MSNTLLLPGARESREPKRPLDRKGRCGRSATPLRSVALRSPSKPALSPHQDAVELGSHKGEARLVDRLGKALVQDLHACIHAHMGGGPWLAIRAPVARNRARSGRSGWGGKNNQREHVQARLRRARIAARVRPPAKTPRASAKRRRTGMPPHVSVSVLMKPSSDPEPYLGARARARAPRHTDARRELLTNAGRLPAPSVCVARHARSLDGKLGAVGLVGGALGAAVLAVQPARVSFPRFPGSRTHGARPRAARCGSSGAAT